MRRLFAPTLAAALASGCATMVPYGIEPSSSIAAARSEYAYIQQGKLDAAIAACTRSARNWPNYYGHYALRARAYYEKRMVDRAVADFSQAIEMQPGIWDLYLDRGRAYARQGSFDEASTDFDRSLALKDSALGRAERAQLSELRNRHQQAVSDSDKAIELDSSVDLAYGVRGAAFIGLKRYREALQDLDGYLGKHPDDPDRTFLRGVAYYYLGEREKALPIADKTVEASSRLNAAFGGDRRLALFDLERRRSTVSEALAKAEKAEADGDWTAAFYGLADAWGKTLDLSLDDRSATAAVRTGMLRAYANLKNKPELPEAARAHLQDARASSERSAAGGRSALASYDRLLAMAPWFAEAYRERAAIRAQLKDFGRASEDLRVYAELSGDTAEARFAREKIRDWEAKGKPGAAERSKARRKPAETGEDEEP